MIYKYNIDHYKTYIMKTQLVLALKKASIRRNKQSVATQYLACLAIKPFMMGTEKNRHVQTILFRTLDILFEVKCVFQ